MPLLLLLSSARSQVPGEVYTESGYDNVNGTDPICWSAQAFQNSSSPGADSSSAADGLSSLDFDGVNWHSDLEPAFVAGPTTMQPSCWEGTSVYIDILPEQVHGSDRLRTHRYYTYHVLARVDLAAIRRRYNLTADTASGGGAFFHSSDGLHDVGLRIEFCPVNGNLCSPFILGRYDELDSHLHVDGDDHEADHYERDGDDHSLHPNRTVGVGRDRRQRRTAFLRATANDGEEYNQEHGLSEYHDGVHYVSIQFFECFFFFFFIFVSHCFVCACGNALPLNHL